MSKIKSKYKKKFLSNTMTYRLFMTLNLTFSVFCLAAVILYLVGNYQDFQDASQNIILSVLSYTSIFNFIFSVLLTVETVFKLISEKPKKKFILRIVYLILTMAFCLVCTGLSSVISFIAAGINGN